MGFPPQPQLPISKRNHCTPQRGCGGHAGLKLGKVTSSCPHCTGHSQGSDHPFTLIHGPPGTPRVRLGHPATTTYSTPIPQRVLQQHWAES